MFVLCRHLIEMHAKNAKSRCLSRQMHKMCRYLIEMHAKNMESRCLSRQMHEMCRYIVEMHAKNVKSRCLSRQMREMHGHACVDQAVAWMQIVECSAVQCMWAGCKGIGTSWSQVLHALGARLIYGSQIA